MSQQLRGCWSFGRVLLKALADHFAERSAIRFVLLLVLGTEMQKVKNYGNL